MLDSIESEGRLAAAARSLGELVGEAPKRAKPLLDAVLAWVVRESSSFTAAAPRATARASAPASRTGSWSRSSRRCRALA